LLFWVVPCVDSSQEKYELVQPRERVRGRSFDKLDERM
jgi:hypothetical protein